MRGVFEQPGVTDAVDAASERWGRAEDAWEAVKDVIARDPAGAGEPITESGKTRAFTFDGARSIGMPSVRVIYVINNGNITIHDAEFYDAPYGYAGHA